MKKIIILLALTLITLAVFAQTNTPRTLYVQIRNADNSAVLATDHPFITYQATITSSPNTFTETSPDGGFVFLGGQSYIKIQLGNFQNQWVVGDNVVLNAQRSSDDAVGMLNNIVIPTGTAAIYWGRGGTHPGTPLILIADTPPATYTVNMTTVPAGYITPSTLGPVTDVTTIYGTYTPTPLPAPATGYWTPANLVIDAATVWTADGDNWVLNQEFVWTETTQYFDEYKLFVNGPDGFAVAGPNYMLDGVTDYFKTATTPDALYGQYTIADPPAGFHWIANPITVGTDTVFEQVFPVKSQGRRTAMNREDVYRYYTASIEFVLEADPVYPVFTVVVNGPAGYTVNGLPFPAIFTDNSQDYTNDLIGLILTPDATVDGTWNPLTITVAAGDFIQGTAAYSFELIPPVQPITYTVVVNGPAGYTVNGNAFPYTLVDANDTVNDLIGMVLTPDTTVDGTWNPLTITVAAADFDPQTNTATYMFELIPCVNQYSWEIVAYDGYDQNDQTTPLAATIWYCDQLFAVWGDPNYTWVNIGTTPLMVWYPCGLWQLGTYRVSHPDYDDDTWVWNQIVWENIFEDYAYTDWYGFRNENGNVPVELSSFTALNVDRNVRLTWVSQTETEMIGYRVLRSNVNDLASAEAITPTAIAATNTSTTQTYNYTDTEVIENNQYYYWLESVDYNASEFFGPVSVFIEVSAPAVTNVSQIVKSAYPNPFKANSNTTIVVDVKTGETGTVTVYNILGQVVRTFSVNAGTNNVSWNGKDSRGNACGSGIYFYKLSTPSVTDTKKLVIVK